MLGFVNALLTNQKDKTMYDIPWKEAVSRIILEILEHRDDLERRMFTGKDLQDFYKRLGRSFEENHSIRESTNKVLQNYRDNVPRVIEFFGRIPPDRKYATYKVTDDGFKVLEIDAMSLEELQKHLEELQKQIEALEQEIKDD